MVCDFAGTFVLCAPHICVLCRTVLVFTQRLPVLTVSARRHTGIVTRGYRSSTYVAYAHSHASQRFFRTNALHRLGSRT